MAAAHPFVAFVGCRFKRIGCVRRIKVKLTQCMLCLDVSYFAKVDSSVPIVKCVILY